MRALVIGSLLLSMSATAQQAPALHERVEVRLLEIKVVVTDKAGRPVHGLTPADFELLEDGKPQQVTNLSESRETMSDTPAAPAVSTATAVHRPEPRTLVLLLDALPLRGRERTAFFDQLRMLVDRVVRPGDRVQIQTWVESAFRPTLDLTTDRDAVRSALDAAAKAPTARSGRVMTVNTFERAMWKRAEVSTIEHGGDKEITAPFDEAALQVERRIVANEELGQMKAKTASMRRIVSTIPTHAGRVIVVFASSQFSRIAGKRAFMGTRSAGAGQLSLDEQAFDTRRLIASVVAAANANSIAFYAVHPQVATSLDEFHSVDDEQVMADHTMHVRPRETGTQAMDDQQLLQNELDALQHLTSETGGAIGVGASGVKKIVEQVASDFGNYYSLGWRARSDGTDRERRVTVRTKNRDHVVRTRTTIVEKSDRTRAEELLVAQLYERGSGGDLDLRVDVQSATRVELVIPIGQLKPVDRDAQFTVMTIAGARDNERTDVRRDTRRVAHTENGVARYMLVIDPKSDVVAVAVYDEHSGEVGIRTIEVAADGTARVSVPPASSIANAAWREAFEKSVRLRKPLVVFFRPKRCPRCDTFENSALTHPAIAQRTPNVVFTVVSWTGYPPPVWPSTQPGVGLFDPSGALGAHWTGVPETMALGRILDGAIASAGNFLRAAALTKSGGPNAGAIEKATALLKLGFDAEARTLLDETAMQADPRQQQRATIALATLRAREGGVDEGLRALTAVRAEPIDDEVAAEAAFNFAVLSRFSGDAAAAQDALRSAVTLAGADSPVGRAAEAELRRGSGTIRLLPFATPVVSGMQIVRTMISSPAIARVTFAVDGKEVATVTSPPFSASVSFGRLPESRRLRVIAYDQSGNEIGRDEMPANAAGNVFWIRLTEPAGLATGQTPVSVELRTPVGRRVTSVALSWNDERLATLTTEPWRAVVRIPNEVGVLRATANLDDGRTAEDATLLNGSGHGERMDVQLVHLPVTVTPARRLAVSDVVVQQGETTLPVESVTSGSELPLTVGLVVDSSSSMHDDLDDVQTAALRFLDSALGANDQAFLISFASSARLVVPTTGNKLWLRDGLLKLLPDGYTALHDAIVLGLLQMEGAMGRRALLVFTDGDDTDSRYSAAEVAELSRRSNVPIYLIAPKLEARDVVRATRASGGQLYELTDIANIGAIYDAIANDLRAQMVVTVRAAGASGQNEWRPIKVQIPGAKVRAPEGYYAPR